MTPEQQLGKVPLALCCVMASLWSLHSKQDLNVVAVLYQGLQILQGYEVSNTTLVDPIKYVHLAIRFQASGSGSYKIGVACNIIAHRFLNIAA